MDQLAFYDRRIRLIVELGGYDVMIGVSSEDIRLRGFEVTECVRVLSSRGDTLVR